MQSGAEPLQGHYRYTKLKDLNKGTYGFVQLALDRLTGDQVQNHGQMHACELLQHVLSPVNARVILHRWQSNSYLAARRSPNMLSGRLSTIHIYFIR